MINNSRCQMYVEVFYMVHYLKALGTYLLSPLKPICVVKARMTQIKHFAIKKHITLPVPKIQA